MGFPLDELNDLGCWDYREVGERVLLEAPDRVIVIEAETMARLEPQRFVPVAESVRMTQRGT